MLAQNDAVPALADIRNTKKYLQKFEERFANVKSADITQTYLKDIETILLDTLLPMHACALDLPAFSKMITLIGKHHPDVGKYFAAKYVTASSLSTALEERAKALLELDTIEENLEERLQQVTLSGKGIAVLSGLLFFGTAAAGAAQGNASESGDSDDVQGNTTSASAAESSTVYTDPEDDMFLFTYKYEDIPQDAKAELERLKDSFEVTKVEVEQDELAIYTKGKPTIESRVGAIIYYNVKIGKLGAQLTNDPSDIEYRGTYNYIEYIEEDRVIKDAIRIDQNTNSIHIPIDSNLVGDRTLVRLRASYFYEKDIQDPYDSYYEINMWDELKSDDVQQEEPTNPQPEQPTQTTTADNTPTAQSDINLPKTTPTFILSAEERLLPGTPQLLANLSAGDDSNVTNNHQRGLSDQSQFTANGKPIIFFKESFGPNKHTYKQYWLAYTDNPAYAVIPTYNPIVLDHHAFDFEAVIDHFDEKGNFVERATSYHVKVTGVSLEHILKFERGWKFTKDQNAPIFVELAGHAMSTHRIDFLNPFALPVEDSSNGESLYAIFHHKTGRTLAPKDYVIVPLEKMIDNKQLDSEGRLKTEGYPPAAPTKFGDAAKVPWKSQVFSAPWGIFSDMLSSMSNSWQTLIQGDGLEARLVVKGSRYVLGEENGAVKADFPGVFVKSGDQIFIASDFGTFDNAQLEIFGTQNGTYTLSMSYSKLSNGQSASVSKEFSADISKGETQTVKIKPQESSLLIQVDKNSDGKIDCTFNGEPQLCKSEPTSAITTVQTQQAANIFPYVIAAGVGTIATIAIGTYVVSTRNAEHAHRHQSAQPRLHMRVRPSEVRTWFMQGSEPVSETPEQPFVQALPATDAQVELDVPAVPPTDNSCVSCGTAVFIGQTACNACSTLIVSEGFVPVLRVRPKYKFSGPAACGVCSWPIYIEQGVCGNCGTKR